jgi:hypothetical protein
MNALSERENGEKPGPPGATGVPEHPWNERDWKNGATQGPNGNDGRAGGSLSVPTQNARAIIPLLIISLPNDPISH